MKELERKFLLKEIPKDLINPLRYERYFILNWRKRQIRIQQKGDSFELEIKSKIDDLLFRKSKIKLSKIIFKILKIISSKERIIRDSYLISDNPNTTVKVYKDKYEGLIRLEVEFDNEKDVKKYILPYKCVEITGNKLANDNNLIKLNREEFLKELNCYLNK